MDVLGTIKTAKNQARQAKERGLKTVRLPVLNFEEWAEFFNRTDDLAGREAYRAWQKRNFYFKRFLEAEGVEVTVISAKAKDAADWAVANNHPLTSNKERTHVLTHYINQPDLPPSQCVHKRPLTTDMSSSGLELFATLTTFGERPDLPEILSAVIHTKDGWVVESLEVLGVEHTPKEAFEMAAGLMARHGVENAFYDEKVRRPEYCPDCGEVLVHTASHLEYEQMDRVPH